MSSNWNFIIQSTSLVVAGRARAEEQFVHKVGQDAVVWNQQVRTYAVVANAPRNELHQIATYVKLNSR